MKKIFLLLFTISFFVFFSINVSACPNCYHVGSLTYHYTVDPSFNGAHHSRSIYVDFSTVSAPVYEIFAKVNGASYVILFSENEFTFQTALSQSNDITTSLSGNTQGPFTKKVCILNLDVSGYCSFQSWEYTDVSRVPSYTFDLPDITDTTILSIDTSGMSPAINADGSLNVPVPFDPYNNEYSDDIPVPEVYRDGDKIMFSNSSPDLLILANIRWYSVDDITLFKEALSWKYRPDSIIHSDLDWLLTVDDLYSSVNGIDLYDLGKQSFQTFLSTYPVDSRTFLGGSNAIGNYLFGYDDALSTLKMILGQIDSSFNAPELFFRYYVPLADGTYKCGKWTKYSRSLPSGASDGAIDGKWNVQYQVSDTPLTSDDVIGSKPYDNTGMTTYTSKDNTVVVDFDSPDYTLSIDNLNQITSLFGQFPSFVTTVFSFLPSWILSLIGCTITLLVGLAVYHALRG